jgi:hypothetical protein
MVISSVKTDKDMVRRPQGSGYDIGAYEYYVGLGITQLTTDISGLKIYPNPTSGEINIVYTNNTGAFDVKIFDSKGFVIYRKTYPAGTRNITIHPNINAGIYFIQLDKEVRKIVVSRN